ncbi:hypothetical protein TSUD_279430 [Trifolium subterraneum]|uniref:RRM domain-containing protein n=1 Tax=Trifolium subterraneum TaxID=3900 RepID=A0A2Z6NNQ8_TRISU|nr:hypothetical protein TSUD_279430 [Trifolium subterraneum]
MAGSGFRRYVSYYFTNFPAQLSNFYLRKGFEVCGILEDVYVPNRRNRRGEPFGFVKFSNVRDVTKLLDALNNVWFGHFRVRARIASFDRKDLVVGRRTQPTTLVEKTETNVPVRTTGRFNSQRPTNSENAIVRREVEGRKTNKGNKGGGGGRESPPEETRVGDIVVKLGARKVTKENTKSQTEEGGLFPNNLGEPAAVAKAKDHQVLLRSYKTLTDDVCWAQKGIVATITNGEAVPVVQNRITDAGFNNLILIPLGADKVFVRSMAGVDALEVVNNAKEFFIFIFSHWMRWDFHQQAYKRGAWVRLYGIPVHAWNVNFFKLCVFDCGTLLRVDSCSADKDRLDFACVLIATPELEIVNKVVNVMVDGTLVTVKVVEEWGYALREDICLFEEERESVMSQPDLDVGHDDMDATWEVNNFVANFAGGLEEEVINGSRATDLASDAQVEIEVRSAEDVVVMPNKSDQVVVSSPVLGSDYMPGSTPRNVGMGDPQSTSEAQGSSSICSPMVGHRRHTGISIKGTQGCFFLLKRGRTEERKSAKGSGRLKGGIESDLECIRSEGVSSSVHSDVSASSVSCTNDWKHWVVMQGSEQVAVEDVVEVGKAIRITPKVNTANRFLKSGEEFSVENVYAPCNIGVKHELWVSLSARIQLLGRSRVCVCGDFNVVRNLDEKRIVNGRSHPLDCVEFNHFIDDNSLIDLPMCARKYTWFKGDELSMSRLDRFLLSGDWCLTWPNCTQVARMRGLSDHCPLVLSANEEDWGHRPSRMLKCWKDIPGYNMFVKDKWNSLQVDGWGGYVLKEKLKRIKMELKDWHNAHTQNLPSKIESLKERLETLDEKGEEDTLLEAELAELHEITADIHSLSQLHTNICDGKNGALVERNLFTGYSMGVVAPVSISHLQLADDMLLMGTKSWANVRAMRAALESGVGGCWWRGTVLWFRVLAARYGLERGRLCEGGMRGSMWWRELVRIRDGTGELEGGWFREYIMRKVGDGSDTFFWTDPWLDGSPLSERFGRLFDLAENKSVLVAEMFSLGDHTSDCWQWQPGLDSGYIVCGAYQLLTEQVVPPLDGASGLIWHPQVPLKVSILAWWLLRDRLPTKVNLITRGILSVAASLCVFGCGEAESAHHLFLSCSTFGSLWHLLPTSWTHQDTIQPVFVRKGYMRRFSVLLVVAAGAFEVVIEVSLCRVYLNIHIIP